MISVVACTKRPAFLNNILLNFTRQELEEKELILILNTTRVDLEQVKVLVDSYDIRYQLFQFKETVSLGECLNHGIQAAAYETVSKFDDDDYYGPTYLVEAYQAITSLKADLVGKCSFYIYFKDEDELYLYNPHQELAWIPANDADYQARYFMSGASLVFKKAILKKVRFPHVNVGEDSLFQQACFQQNMKMYSLSKSNYVYIRYQETGHHTSDAKKFQIKKRSQWIKNIKEADLYELIDHF
ncbi:glycosyltransferase [Pullulanibacillus sp. KACC 23026]|uniref:glycosyltransferase n=1 Tax=Pullulanibacillus sp. KACC 23026 TaxID=3028315 RepID=UPI0023B1823E|nr:glycosyltransferase [Pullulanibacillus sp. KACC 23026]WEG10999.1 glycosyltransferase [Pullulanibacillus sp. KACC 23026]